MKRAPAYAPDYLTRHPYATLVGDEYKRGARYHRAFTMNVLGNVILRLAEVACNEDIRRGHGGIGPAPPESLQSRSNQP